MAFLILADGTVPITLLDGDRAYIGRDVDLTTEATALKSGANADSISVAIDGSVVSADGYGVQLDPTGSNAENFQVDIGAAGAVRSLTAGFAGVSAGGTATQVRSAGEITGYNGINLEQASFGRVFNSGLIKVINTGIEALTSANSEIINTGEIVGSTGIFVGTGTNLTIVNTGTIVGLGSAGATIDASFASGVSVVNHGLIQNTFYAMRGSTFGDFVDNSGMINGSIDLGEGDDFYSGRRGEVNGLVFGGEGSDALRGGAADDSFNGGTGNDVLLGRNGDDFLFGEDEDDEISGGRGDDEIFGGSGADLMRGGRDADTFVFQSHTDFAATGATDRILDFKRGEDVIDLSAFIGTFVFMGAKAFKGGGKASVSLQVKKGDTIVKLDTDGDGTMDGRFFVDDVSGLAAADFLL